MTKKTDYLFSNNKNRASSKKPDFLIKYMKTFRVKLNPKP